MNDERVEPLFSRGNPWFVVAVSVTVGVLIVSAIIGFVWLPSVQRDAPFQGVWNAICSAAGVPRQWLQGGAPVESTERVSNVQITPQLLAHPDANSIGRGATLALRCTMCHGERGISDANSPNLAGQYAPAVYKQLRDFQSGARVNAVMSPMAVNLSDEDMRDLAAYYASLPRTTLQRTAAAGTAPDIVAHGSPMRNIVSCAACHGGMDNKAGSPWLGGLPQPYIKAQLQAFASGARHNDIDEQMRNVARQMTPDEIDAAAQFYSGAGLAAQ